MAALTKLRVLSRFRTDERGSIPIEGLLGALMLLTWYAVAFQFYDAFRMRAVATRASYTVADMLSREKLNVGPTYVGGMQKVFDFITNATINRQTWIRVTMFHCPATETDKRPCDGETKDFAVDRDGSGNEVSYATLADISTHTDASLKLEGYRIPKMAAGDTAVLLESSYWYNPVLGIGTKELAVDGKNFTRNGFAYSVRFSNFVVTRPRGPKVVWDPTK